MCLTNPRSQFYSLLPQLNKTQETDGTPIGHRRRESGQPASHRQGAYVGETEKAPSTEDGKTDGGTAPDIPRGLFRSPRKQWCQMADIDFIGDATGGLTHYWPGRLSEKLEDQASIPDARSGKKLFLDQDLLDSFAAEIRAAVIAHNIYIDYKAEFWTPAYNIAGINARDIATRFSRSEWTGDGTTNAEKWLIGYTGASEEIVGFLQELAWLRSALSAGATQADLLAWGVSKFTVVQLGWWERKPGETRLSQHIRAIRNGWGLRYLDQSVRDVYGNLIRTVDAQQPAEFIERWSDDLTDVRALLAFFDEDTPTLSDTAQAAWAKAFLDAGITKIAPDAWGQFAHFLPASFKAGELRKPLEPIARYLESIGVGPKDWAGFDESWFGR